MKSSSTLLFLLFIVSFSTILTFVEAKNRGKESSSSSSNEDETNSIESLEAEIVKRIRRNLMENEQLRNVLQDSSNFVNNNFHRRRLHRRTIGHGASPKNEPNHHHIGGGVEPLPGKHPHKEQSYDPYGRSN